MTTDAPPSLTPPSPAHRRRRLLRRSAVVPALLVAALLAGVAGYLFQPWKLVLDDVVDDALPVVTAPAAAPSAESGDAPSAQGGDGSPAGSGAPAPAIEVLATGRFVSHEHDTTGGVRVLRLPDGSRVLRLDDLATSNGPALRVWVTDAPVRAGRDGWFVFDDGRYVDLGPLRGNVGNQNYALPADVDLTELASVSIWCDRFNVSFGAAQLRPSS